MGRQTSTKPPRRTGGTVPRRRLVVQRTVKPPASPGSGLSHFAKNEQLLGKKITVRLGGRFGLPHRPSLVVIGRTLPGYSHGALPLGDHGQHSATPASNQTPAVQPPKKAGVEEVPTSSTPSIQLPKTREPTSRSFQRPQTGPESHPQRRSPRSSVHPPDTRSDWWCCGCPVHPPGG